MSVAMKFVALSSIFDRRVTSWVCGHEMPLSVMPTSKLGCISIILFTCSYVVFTAIKSLNEICNRAGR